MPFVKAISPKKNWNSGTWNLELFTTVVSGMVITLEEKWGNGPGNTAPRPRRKKVYVGKITNYYSRSGIAEVKIEAHPLHAGDDILIIGPTTGVFEDKVNEIWLDEKKVDKTGKGDLCTIPVRTFLRPSDKLYKWVDSRKSRPSLIKKKLSRFYRDSNQFCQTLGRELVVLTAFNQKLTFR